jgi:hypothetical protein
MFLGLLTSAGYTIHKTFNHAVKFCLTVKNLFFSKKKS